MLELLWTIIFAGAAVACLVRAFGDGFAGPDVDIRFLLAGMALHMLAIVVSQDYLLIPVFRWLTSALPEYGELINLVTALVLMGVGFAAWVALTTAVCRKVLAVIKTRWPRPTAKRRIYGNGA